mmetsp:Transcript_41619/g.109645  ORF Transcript_41619/g.109645 Transcript_41619/m.109645 type:complete len:256 (-) Transcript_41619:1675-2442(-)
MRTYVWGWCLSWQWWRFAMAMPRAWARGLPRISARTLLPARSARVGVCMMGCTILLSLPICHRRSSCVSDFGTAISTACPSSVWRKNVHRRVVEVARSPFATGRRCAHRRCTSARGSGQGAARTASTPAQLSSTTFSSAVLLWSTSAQTSPWTPGSRCPCSTASPAPTGSPENSATRTWTFAPGRTRAGTRARAWTGSATSPASARRGTRGPRARRMWMSVPRGRVSMAGGASTGWRGSSACARRGMRGGTARFR